MRGISEKVYVPSIMFYNRASIQTNHHWLENKKGLKCTAWSSISDCGLPKQQPYCANLRILSNEDTSLKNLRSVYSSFIYCRSFP
jgi:hypothetical protein